MMVSWVHALSVHNHWIGQWCGNGNEPASTLRHLAVATSCRHTSGVDWRFLNVRAARKRLWIWLQTELHTACRGLTAGYSMVKKAYPDSSNWNSFLRCRFQWQQQYWCRVLQLRMGAMEKIADRRRSGRQSVRTNHEASFWRIFLLLYFDHRLNIKFTVVGQCWVYWVIYNDISDDAIIFPLLSIGQIIYSRHSSSSIINTVSIYM